MKKDFLKTILFTLLTAFAFQMVNVSKVSAEDKITVKLNDSNGQHLQGNELFKVDNIYPGWSQTKTIYVKNKSVNYDTDLYFLLDVNGDKKLAKELKLYVTRLGSNQSVRIGGSGDRYDLDSADDEELFLDRLSKDAGKRYRIKIKFDKDAGNEFQGLSTEFDMDFTIKGIIDPNQTEEEILAIQNRVVPAENLTEEEAEAEVLGEKTPTISEEGAGDEGIVEGATTDCKNTNKWPWVIALAILATILFINAWKKNKEEGYGWIFDTAAVVILIIAWYFLENCHLLRWVPVSAIVIGIVTHFLIPYFLETKKGISQIENKS